MSRTSVRTALALAGFSILTAACGPMQEAAEKKIEADAQRMVDDIERKVAGDAVAQYNIVRQSGSAIDLCVQAGLVSAAMLQAQDEAGYAEWKAVERRDCGEAGLAR